VTGPAAEAHRALLRAYFGPAATGLPPNEVTPDQVEQLASNKYTVLPYNGSTTDLPATLDPAVRERIQQQQQRHGAWLEMVTQVVPILDQIKPGYVLMKALESPFAPMSDIDFLIPQPDDIVRSVTALAQEGFEFYRFRLWAHPLKIMAVPAGQSVKAPAAVDFYPDAMWIRKHVLDGVGVIARRQRTSVRGVEVYTPVVEDDFYLVVTHALARGDIMLGELDHGARLLAHSGFDWDRVLRAARAFGCLDNIYVYLRLLQMVCQALDRAAPIPVQLWAELERYAINRQWRGWLDRVEPNVIFPLRFPLRLGTIQSGAYHLPAVRARLRPGEWVFDAITHGHLIVTHLLRRD
jgi:hypothetical protein